MNDHVIQLTSEDNTIIRKQSLDERFTQSSVEFVKQVLIDQLHSSSELQKLPFLDSFNHVYIQDSTKFKLPHSFKSTYPGYHQSGASIQLVLDIKHNKFSHLSIHPQTYNDVREASNIKWISPDSLVIRDLGYFSLDGFKAIEDSKSFFLSRLQPRSALFECKDESYIRFDMDKLLRRMKKYKLQYIEEYLYLSHEHKLPVRVCFSLVPKSVREQRLRDREKTNKGRGWKPSKEYDVWTWFNAYITNADSVRIPASIIPEIYRYRWQIELVFKTWKSNYHLEKMKSMKTERMECYLYSLILKTLLHRNIMNACSPVIKDKMNQNSDISFMKFVKLIIILDKGVHNMVRQMPHAVDDFINILDKQNKSMLMKDIKRKPANFMSLAGGAQLVNN